MIPTVNDLIGLNLANLRNPVVPQSNVSQITPIQKGNTQNYMFENTSYVPPIQSGNTQNYMFENTSYVPPLMSDNTGIVPLLESDGRIPFGSSVDNIQGFTDKVDFSTPKQKMNLSGLMQLASNVAIPGASLLTGGLRGLAGLNRRIQQSDFGRSTSLMDYLDARKYGGIDARNRAAAQNMRETRAIQKQLDLRTQSGKYDDGGDRNRGQTPSRTKTTSKKTSSRSSRHTSGSGGLHSKY